MEKLILNFPFPIFIYWLLTANRWQLIWAFRRSRRAFRYIFARQTGVGIWERDQELGMESNLVPVPESRSRYPLAKDAAPIPNALETETEIGNGDGK